MLVEALKRRLQNLPCRKYCARTTKCEDWVLSNILNNLNMTKLVLFQANSSCTCQMRFEFAVVIL